MLILDSPNRLNLWGCRTFSEPKLSVPMKILRVLALAFDGKTERIMLARRKN